MPLLVVDGKVQGTGREPERCEWCGESIKAGGQTTFLAVYLDEVSGSAFRMSVLTYFCRACGDINAVLGADGLTEEDPHESGTE